jgi:hypothetical protein
MRHRRYKGDLIERWMAAPRVTWAVTWQEVATLDIDVDKSPVQDLPDAQKFSSFEDNHQVPQLFCYGT